MPTLLVSNYYLCAIAVETVGHLNTPACQIFANLKRKISSTSGEKREGAFWFLSLPVDGRWKLSRKLNK